MLEGLRGEDSIAELCRKEGIAQNFYYRWSKEFLEAGKKRLAGNTAREATSDEVKTLRAEARQLWWSQQFTVTLASRLALKHLPTIPVRRPPSGRLDLQPITSFTRSICGLPPLRNDTLEAGFLAGRQQPFRIRKLA